MDGATVEITLTDGPVAYRAPDAFPAPCGAECVFLGRTRGETHSEHGALRELAYEAYRPMAERELRTLAAETAARFGATLVRVDHAVGIVPVGAASVVVQIACPHRGAAFDACRHLMDELKRRVPIWKRETWADGTTWTEGTPVPVSEEQPRS